MKIAVISDTHMDTPPEWLDKVYTTWLSPTDYLVHCGDITSASTWSYFMQHDNFICVRGNCDWDTHLVDTLPHTVTVEMGPLTVGAAHGWGPRSHVSTAVTKAFGPGYDLICYGHTHKRDWSVVEGVQVINPGSLGESMSLAIVTVSDDGAMDCEFIDAL